MKQHDPYQFKEMKNAGKKWCVVKFVNYADAQDAMEAFNQGRVEGGLLERAPV